mmetsp:Transcript_1137/g.2309  ORF Transcript_1137/g.2309 Transcript_1137/m.2309 type:complete len:217 (-) Transcript_1137:153-803(-)
MSDYEDVALLCGLLKSAALVTAVTRETLHRGVALEKGLANLEVTLTSSNRERCPALVTAIISICVVLQQCLADHVVPLTCCHQKRSGTILAQGIHVRLHGEEIIADLQMSNVAGLMERCVAVGALGVEVAPLLNEQLEDRRFSAVGGLLQESSTLGIPELDTHALGDEDPNAVSVSLLAELVQIDKNQTELVNELQLKCMKLVVVQAPHEKPRSPS